jgi:hypothetical protein
MKIRDLIPTGERLQRYVAVVGTLIAALSLFSSYYQYIAAEKQARVAELQMRPHLTVRTVAVDKIGVFRYRGGEITTGPRLRHDVVATAGPLSNLFVENFTRILLVEDGRNPKQYRCAYLSGSRMLAQANDHERPSVLYSLFTPNQHSKIIFFMQQNLSKTRFHGMVVEHMLHIKYTDSFADSHRRLFFGNNDGFLRLREKDESRIWQEWESAKIFPYKPLAPDSMEDDDHASEALLRWIESNTATCIPIPLS